MCFRGRFCFFTSFSICMPMPLLVSGYIGQHAHTHTSMQFIQIDYSRCSHPILIYFIVVVVVVIAFFAMFFLVISIDCVRQGRKWASKQRRKKWRKRQTEKVNCLLLLRFAAPLSFKCVPFNAKFLFDQSTAWHSQKVSKPNQNKINCNIMWQSEGDFFWMRRMMSTAAAAAVWATVEAKGS